MVAIVEIFCEQCSVREIQNIFYFSADVHYVPNESVEELIAMLKFKISKRIRNVMYSVNIHYSYPISNRWVLPASLSMKSLNFPLELLIIVRHEKLIIEYFSIWHEAIWATFFYDKHSALNFTHQSKKDYLHLNEN